MIIVVSKDSQVQLEAHNSQFYSLERNIRQCSLASTWMSHPQSAFAHFDQLETKGKYRMDHCLWTMVHIVLFEGKTIRCHDIDTNTMP